jgi:site-specific DNA recombinase
MQKGANPAMKTGIAYYRYSSEMQTEYSIEGQREAVQRYAKNEGIVIVKEFIDREKSGKTSHRPEFLEMIHSLKKGILEVDYVLWHKFDRFARNRTDAAIYRREIRRLGIKPIAVDQPLDPETRPEDIIMESLMDGMAEYYSRNLATETMKGLKAVARECRFTGGWAPLGYSIEDKKYVINDTEAPAIRTIFKLADMGMSYRNICDELEKAGYKTRRGKKFVPNSIHDILRNPKYTGVYTFNRASQRSHDGSRNWRKQKDEEDQIIIPDGVPAIIGKDLFWRVQKMLDARKNRINPRQKEKGVLYILTGKTFCGDCGSPVTGTSQYRAKGGPTYRYYMCTDKQKKCNKSKCSSKRWPKEKTEEAILREIKRELTSPNLAKHLFKLYKERNRKQDSQQETILQEIQSLTDRTNRLLDMVESGIGDMTAAAERIDQYTKRKKDLEYELAQTAAQVEYTVEHFRGYLDHISGNLDSKLDPYQAKKIIDTYVEKIILYPDNRVEVILKFNIPTDPNGYGKKGREYNVGAEGASLTYTHRFSLV